MKSSIVKDKKSTKCRDSVVHRHLLKSAQQGTSQSGKPPQGAGTPSKPRDAEYSITPKARPSGLTEQGASTGKPAEEDTTVQKLPTAKTKLSETARRKLRKAKAGQSGTGSLTQPGHETLSQPSMGPKRPRSGGHTPTEQPPKKLRTPLEPWSYKEALLNFRVAILLDHPEEKLSLEDVNLVLAKVGEVFRETPDGGHPLLRFYRLERGIIFYAVLIKGL
jgi:hypothetical protein